MIHVKYPAFWGYCNAFYADVLIQLWMPELNYSNRKSMCKQIVPDQAAPMRSCESGLLSSWITFEEWILLLFIIIIIVIIIIIITIMIVHLVQIRPFNNQVSECSFSHYM